MLFFEADRALVQLDGSSPIGPLLGPARLVLELVVPGHSGLSLSIRMTYGHYREPSVVDGYTTISRAPQAFST
jgi:hypothetical protein